VTRRPPWTMALGLVIGVGVLVVLFALPQWNEAPQVRLYASAIYIGVAAMGLNLLTGYNGQVSIGHGAFFGLGAYTSAILVNRGWEYENTLPMAAALCFVVGAAVGFPALKVKGLYLALVTLGLAVLFPDLTRWPWLIDRIPQLRGVGGTNLVQIKSATRRTPDWAESFAPDADQYQYYVTLVVALVLLAAMWLLVRGRFGRSLIAVRDHEAAAETVGINLARVKVTAFALSALYAGVAGSLAVLVTGVANAEKVQTFRLSIQFLVAVVIGGTATVLGPIIGAWLVVLLQDVIDKQDTLEDWLGSTRAKLVSPALFGIALILAMYVLPDGLVGGSRRLLGRLRRRRPFRPRPAAPGTSPAETSRTTS
jgi:branched-chain amino acid transport system permease protein